MLCQLCLCVKRQLRLLANLCYLLRMADEKKDQRIPIMMSLSEVEQVDQWRAKQPGLPSRAEAIRRLVQTALNHGNA